MISVNVQGIDIFNPLSGKLRKVTNAFVEYYGEEYRDIISERLIDSRVLFLHKYDGEDISKKIENYLTENISKWENEIFETFPYYNDKQSTRLSVRKLIELNERIKKQKLTSIDYFLIENVYETFGLKNYVNPPRSMDEHSIRQWFKLSKNKHAITEALDKIEFMWNSGYKHKENEILQDINNIPVEVFRIEQKLRRIARICKNKQKDLVYDYVKEISSRSITENEALTVKNAYYSLLTKGKEAFLRERTISAINDQYITLFNVLGYDLGSDIKKYKECDELLDIVFDEDLIDEFNKISNSLIKARVEADGYYKEGEKILDELKINGDVNLYKSVLYSYLYNSGMVVAVATDYVDTLCHKHHKLIFCEDALTCDDETLFHELNHAIESGLTSRTKDACYAKCGFVKSKVPLENDEESKREILKYQMLNEIINDYFSLEVAKIARKNDVKICLNDYSNPSTYSKAFPLFGKFIENNKNIIVNCRLVGNPHAMAELMGQEDFDRLADIATQYLTMVNTGVLYAVEAEIKSKTGIKKAVFNARDEYINKNIQWSDKAKYVLAFYKNVDEITKNFETRKLGIVKSNGKYILQ